MTSRRVQLSRFDNARCPWSNVDDGQSVSVVEDPAVVDMEDDEEEEDDEDDEDEDENGHGTRVGGALDVERPVRVDRNPFTDRGSRVETAAVMCIAPTSTSPSAIPASSTAACTSSVMRMNSRRRSVWNVRWIV